MKQVLLFHVLRQRVGSTPFRVEPPPNLHPASPPQPPGRRVRFGPSHRHGVDAATGHRAAALGLLLPAALRGEERPAGPAEGAPRGGQTKEKEAWEFVFLFNRGAKGERRRVFVGGGPLPISRPSGTPLHQIKFERFLDGFGEYPQFVGPDLLVFPRSMFGQGRSIGVLFGCFARKIDGFRFLVYLVV